MISDILRKYKIDPLSLIIVAVCLIAMIAAPLLLRRNFGSAAPASSAAASKKEENTRFLTDEQLCKSIKFELSCPDPLIDLKFIDDRVLFALTYDGDDILNIFRLDIENGETEQTFSIFLNPEEDYCGLTRLNNGGFAFTTNGRIVYLSRELKPQTEVMLPKAGSSGRYDCVLSPSGERVAYIDSRGLYTNSVEFDEPKLLLSNFESGIQVRILRKPVWIDRGARILYHFEDSGNIDSVGFIASAGLEDTVLSSPSVGCFAYSDEKNTFFIAPDSLEIIPHEDAQTKKKVGIDSLNLDFVVSDNDGRRLMLIGEDALTQNTRYDVMNLATMKTDTAFMLHSGGTIPCEPMALSITGLFAAHVESDAESNTRIFIYSVKEGF